jgi:hypothetical protein
VSTSFFVNLPKEYTPLTNFCRRACMEQVQKFCRPCICNCRRGKQSEPGGTEACIKRSPVRQLYKTQYKCATQKGERVSCWLKLLQARLNSLCCPLSCCV